MQGLAGPAAWQAVRKSLERQGQFVPVMVYAPEKNPCVLEVVDGFKRLRAARSLGWRAVRVRLLQCTDAEAKAAVSLLNQGQGLSALEEAWVVQALYREDRLKQPEIGRLLSRDKSWVSRRLQLISALPDAALISIGQLILFSSKSGDAWLSAVDGF